MQGPGIGPAGGVALLPPGLHEPRHRPRHRSALAALQVTFSFNLPLIHLSWISFSSHPWTSHRPLYLSWDSKMLGKEMPSLTWKEANHLAIAYHPDKVNLEEIIPVAIEKDGQYSVYTKFEILLSIQQGGFHSFPTCIRVFNPVFFVQELPALAHLAGAAVLILLGTHSSLPFCSPSYQNNINQATTPPFKLIWTSLSSSGSSSPICIRTP